MKLVTTSCAIGLLLACAAPPQPLPGSKQQAFVNAVPTPLVTSIDLGSHSLGAAVASDGASIAVLAVGKDGADGAVALFTPDGDGWTERHVFTPAEPTSLLGAGLALDGDTVAIGDVDVTIYRGAGPDWQPEAVLSGEFLHVSFGSALSLDGDRLAIGDAESITDDSAYVYERAGQSWTERAHLTPDTTEDLQFGAAVALEGDVVVVGAPGPVVPGLDGPLGSAHVYRWNGGSWVHSQELSASTPVPGDRFGDALALSNGTLLVGAWRSALNGAFGTISVFDDVDGSFVEVAVITSKVGGVSFGDSLAFDGTTLLVASNDIDAPGSVESFTRDGSAFVPGPILSDVTLPPGASFGESIALSGEIAAVGAPDASAAYAYRLLAAKQCSADATSVVETNGATTPCAPYFCSAGACATSCATSNDCSADHVCDTSLGAGQCVPKSGAAAAGDDAGGCAIAPVREPARGVSWLFVLTLIAALSRALQASSGCQYARSDEAGL